MSGGVEGALSDGRPYPYRNYRYFFISTFLGILVFMNFHMLRISKMTKFLLSIFNVFVTYRSIEVCSDITNQKKILLLLRTFLVLTL